mmetsp:Transcript_91001/g.237070  ORF Transcript_91001/g.237070 Transcript_91001/m.237070 type:complete len:109 (-) Transcript_91001:53-379(-)
MGMMKSQRVAGHHLLAIAVTALAMLKAPLSGVFERSGLSGGLHAEIAEELLSVCYLTLMIVCMELHVHGVRGDERCDARGGRGGERGQEGPAAPPALRLVVAMLTVSM